LLRAALFAQSAQRPTSRQHSSAYERQSMKPSVFLAALAAVVIWSAGPAATKVAVAELPALAVAAARICIGGVIALPLGLALRIPLPRERRQAVALVLSSISGFIAFPMLFCLGMIATTGTHGVMILAFLPVMTGLIANLWDRRFPRGMWWFGCALALIGEALLLLPGSSGQAHFSEIRGDALVVCSTVFLAFGYVSGGRLTRAGYPSQGTTYWGVGLASLVMAPLLPHLIGGTELSMVTWAAWASLVYLALGVTVGGYVLWYWALGHGGIAKVGLIQFFQPASGLMLSHLLLNEALSLQIFLAVTLVIGGVVTANRRLP
jgi:drug/metabolite transporter (DMT)-like permease